MSNKTLEADYLIIGASFFAAFCLGGHHHLLESIEIKKEFLDEVESIETIIPNISEIFLAHQKGV